MLGAASAIGFMEEWPVNDDVEGKVRWASAYFAAAEKLHFETDVMSNPFYCGPVIHSAGLATELVFKAILSGGGTSQQELRKLGHNTYEAYCAARKYYCEVKFVKLHMQNTKHRSLPKEIEERLTAKGESDPDTRWRIYFDHLRLLDTLYDRPFRGRYFSPGDFTLPDTEFVLIGAKIFLSAMEERLGIAGQIGGSRAQEGPQMV